jgi:hypothetical protein
MQITETRQNGPTEAQHLPSNWWLVPSVLCGAAIWAGLVVAMVG